jgi:hypothetical protein
MALNYIYYNLGQIMNCLLTPGNLADNKEEVLKTLLADLQGQCYGHRGYLTKLFEFFYEKGLTLLTKIKRNMKNVLVKMDQKIKPRKRALIESVNAILTSVFDIEHSRHRKSINALAHLFAALIAYCFYDSKPAVYLPKNQNLLMY